MEPQEIVIEFNVNGKKENVSIDTRETLLDVLRDRMGLTGAKKGCDETACGACTVLLGGHAVCSCTVLAAEANGAEITTIEGITEVEFGRQVQEAFAENDAFQCGFCTSGQIVSAVSFLKSRSSHSDKGEIREGMSGNVCRCGAYTSIVQAVMEAGRKGALPK